MKKLIGYFDRAYIINLPDRADRRQDVEHEFHKIGLEIPTDKVRFYSAIRPGDKGAFPTVGLRGSFLSHREILRIAFRDGLRNVLVFEDDICFRIVNEHFVQQIIGAIPNEHWDVIYFGYLEPSDHFLTGEPLLAWSKPTQGGHFYAVNRDFIGKMIQFMNASELRDAGDPDGGPMGRDAMYNHIRLLNQNIRVFISIPNLAYQRSSRTDLHVLKIYDQIDWLAPAIRRIRKIKTQVRMWLDKFNTNRRLH
jgi:glycosyl transferase family 25